MSVFSERVASLRREANLSLRQLSKLSGISSSAIHAYEIGTREAGYQSLEALSDVFNCDIDYLVGKSDIKNSAANALGYNSLYEAYKQNSPLSEGEVQLLEVYRRASDEMKPILVNSIKALEQMPLEKLLIVAELLAK